jgi:hypothetical protein
VKGKLIALPYNAPGRETIYREAREAGMKIQPLKKMQLAHCALKQNCDIKELCVMCGRKIAVAIFKNNGVCCELCRKDRDGDHGEHKAIIEAPIGGER